MFKLSQKIFFLITILAFPILPQAFGFGCLGFVGGFGGYSYQQYQPDGLNKYVTNFNSTYSGYSLNQMADFSKAAGYRVGINVFRAKFTGLFITAKGYFQQLIEEHNAITPLEVDYKYNLKLKSWGIGVDVGIPLTNRLSWKIVDGSLLINSASFTETINSSLGTSVNKFDNDKTEIGYSIGTGFIYDIIKDYISIEGVASYTLIEINKMKTENGRELLYSADIATNSDKFIRAGGFSAVVQLNLGFPL